MRQPASALWLNWYRAADRRRMESTYVTVTSSPAAYLRSQFFSLSSCRPLCALVVSLRRMSSRNAGKIRSDMSACNEVTFATRDKWLCRYRWFNPSFCSRLAVDVDTAADLREIRICFGWTSLSSFAVCPILADVEWLKTPLAVAWGI